VTSSPLADAAVTSSPALGAIALGLPAATLILAAIWARPGAGVAFRAAASLVVAALAVGGTALALRTHPSGAATPQGPPGATMPAATCSPDGAVLRLTARDFAFDRDCLAAHAGRPFRIVLENADAGVPHNVGIYADAAGTEPLFTGDEVRGPGTATYRVPALEAGTYLFRCDFHPQQMRGALVVA